MDLVLREAGTDTHTCPHSHTQSMGGDLPVQKALSVIWAEFWAKKKQEVLFIHVFGVLLDYQVLGKPLLSLPFYIQMVYSHTLVDGKSLVTLFSSHRTEVVLQLADAQQQQSIFNYFFFSNWIPTSPLWIHFGGYGNCKVLSHIREGLVLSDRLLCVKNTN